MESLGQYRIAQEIRHEKFLSRVVDSTLLAQRWEFEARFLEEREDDLQNRILEFQSKSFDKIQSYNNFIVTLGYAGFFAIWSFTNSSLAEVDRILIALLLGFSIIIFIYWTLTQSFRLTLMSREAARVLATDFNSRDEFQQAWREYELSLAKKVAENQKAYPAYFICSAGTGFLAGTYLLILLAAKVANIPFSVDTLLKALG